MILADTDPAKEQARKKANLLSVFVTGDYDVRGEVERERGKKVEPLITEREKALRDMLKYQREDFEGLFRAMKGFPVTIRTLDPPLHEFLPHDEKGQAEMAKEMGVTPQVIADSVKALHEFNQMIGFRGCRLGIVYTEITELTA